MTTLRPGPERILDLHAMGRRATLNENLDYIRIFAGFPLTLRRFMRQPLTLPEARRIVEERMEQRGENFLRFVERSVYGHPGSPYLALLKLAGCEQADLRTLVTQKGVEGTLSDLRQAGVYVTFEEFKGRRPIVRDGLTLPVLPEDFDNPFARRDFSLQTGGSTGLAMAVGQGLDYIAAGAPHQIIAFSAYDLLDAPTVYWMGILPGSALRFILQRAFYRGCSDRWYSSVGWRESRYWPKYALGTLYMVFWMRVFGTRVPVPRIARLDQALVVARWVHQALRSHGRCLLYVSTSRALRVSMAAQEAGLDLSGATARVGGEPVTPAKVDAIRRSGLDLIPAYGAVETGTIGFGCKNPIEPDDMHFLHDAFALITVPHQIAGAGVTVPAFNLTSLLDTSPKVLLNYQSDDFGIIEERACGCELGALGYTTHLQQVRSYGKLVGEAVTLIGSEMLDLLEQVMPTRFGGTPLDYQLVEEEDEQGFTRLYFVISPRVELDDEQAVIEALLQALHKSSPMADAARMVWQQANTIQIRRQEPVTTAHGKLLPLLIQRDPQGTSKQ